MGGLQALARALLWDRGMTRIRIALLVGGPSAEHEISLLSARHVLSALDPARFEPVLLGIDREGRWLPLSPERLLQSTERGDPRGLALRTMALDAASATTALAARQVVERVDVVFPVLHGTLGEDGAIQGLLEVMGVPYVGSSVLGSAVGMDKDVQKRLLMQAGLPVADFRVIHRRAFERGPSVQCALASEVGFPCFVKPANQGSSVGVTRVQSVDGLAGALRAALEWDDKALCEARVVGREVECAVLDGDPPRASAVGEVEVTSADGFYSYDAKYVDERGARLHVPARIPAETAERVRTLALQVFDVLGARGLARVDFFADDAGNLTVNEINTMPGFTSHSMYPRLWEASGVDGRELVTTLVDLALARGRGRRGR